MHRSVNSYGFFLRLFGKVNKNGPQFLGKNFS